MGRPMTEAQRAALAQGRAAKLAKGRAAKLADSPLRRQATTTTPTVPTLDSATLTKLGVSSTVSNAPDDDDDGAAPLSEADALNVIFSMGDAPAKPKRTVPLSAAERGESAPAPRKRGRPPKAKPAPSESTFSATDGPAGQNPWFAPLAGDVFVLVATWLVGAELAPDESTTAHITAPISRIVWRHMPLVRDLSDDGRDAMEAGTALLVWVLAIAPELRARQAERKVQKANNGQTVNGSISVPGVPSNQRGPGAAWPANPASGSAGYREGTASVGTQQFPGGDESERQRPTASYGAADPSAAFEDIGIRF